MTPIFKLQQKNTDLSEEAFRGKKQHMAQACIIKRKFENKGTFANLNLNRDTKQVIQRSKWRSIETVTHLQSLNPIQARGGCLGTPERFLSITFRAFEIIL